MALCSLTLLALKGPYRRGRADQGAAMMLHENLRSQFGRKRQRCSVTLTATADSFPAKIEQVARRNGTTIFPARTLLALYGHGSAAIELKRYQLEGTLPCFVPQSS